MFIRHSVHIDHPVAACTTAPDERRPGMVSATHRQERRLGRPRMSRACPCGSVSWSLLVRQSKRRLDRHPVELEGNVPRNLFPAMTGRIELAPVDRDVSRLTVSGMYEPPLGRLGKQLNSSLMQGTADSTVKELARVDRRAYRCRRFSSREAGLNRGAVRPSASDRSPIRLRSSEEPRAAR